jgi:hypothetical protein
VESVTNGATSTNGSAKLEPETAAAS